MVRRAIAWTSTVAALLLAVAIGASAALRSPDCDPGSRSEELLMILPFALALAVLLAIASRLVWSAPTLRSYLLALAPAAVFGLAGWFALAFTWAGHCVR